MRIELVRANFVGAKESLSEVLDLLKSTGSFQMTRYQKVAHNDEMIDQEKFDNYTVLLRRLERACVLGKVKAGDKTEVGYYDFKKFGTTERLAMDIVKKIEQDEHEIAHLDGEIQKHKNAIRDIKEYFNLPVAFDKIKDTSYTKVHLGIMPTKKLEQFMRDFDLKKMGIKNYKSGKFNQIVILTSHKDDAEIAEVIHAYNFVNCRFAYSNDAITQSKILQDELLVMIKKRKKVLESMPVGVQEAEILKSFHDYISNEIDTMDLTAGALQTQKYYVLNGWVIASEQEEIKKILKHARLDVMANFEKAKDEDEDMPVLLKNNPVVTPFRNITNMYGAPGKRDIDPNPWVALFYFVFFGMMIGDIGYGVVLACAISAFIYYKKPTQNVKQFLMLFGICAISAIIWGFIFGSIFGFTIGTQVVDPLKGAIYVLLLALGFGLIQMAVGVFLSLYVQIKNKEYIRAAIKGFPRVILFIGLILFLPKLALSVFNLSPVALFNSVNRMGMYITIFGAILTAASNPYTLINYFNDVISYVRLFALALVGTVIATIGNTMGEMLFNLGFIGYIFGVLIAVAFHVFNLGLGLLSAYIHGARLQFIEFFSKFYRGDGFEFRPLGANLKYTNTKGGKVL
jgi:V/A-type H+-transporting ATPase subunit I